MRTKTCNAICYTQSTSRPSGNSFCFIFAYFTQEMKFSRREGGHEILQCRREIFQARLRLMLKTGKVNVICTCFCKGIGQTNGDFCYSNILNVCFISVKYSKNYSLVLVSCLSHFRRSYQLPSSGINLRFCVDPTGTCLLTFCLIYPNVFSEETAAMQMKFVIKNTTS